MVGWGIDWQYMILVALPSLLIGLWAQARVKSAYGRASQIRSRRGLTGAEAAQSILDSSGVPGVEIEPTDGFLSDHYHPLQKKLRLSEANYAGDSLAAVGIAAHEAGHAIQHAQGYRPLMLRSALVPLCQLGNLLGMIAMALGFILIYAAPHLGKPVLFFGILGYSVVFLFTLVTVPVEYNASSRALAVLTENGIVSPDEIPEVRNVLSAAALTYVAASVTALLNLLYLISVYNRHRDD
jgi:hypothetical protein